MPLIAPKARVEELVRIRKVRTVRKGKLHLVFVGVANRDHAIARPHGASHPLPFLDNLRGRPPGYSCGCSPTFCHASLRVLQSYRRLMQRPIPPGRTFSFAPPTLALSLAAATLSLSGF